MKLKYLLGLILGVLCLPVKASIKQTEVYVPIQKEFISVKASSEFKDAVVRCASRIPARRLSKILYAYFCKSASIVR